MPRHRFFAPISAFRDRDITLPPAESHHLSNVLRLGEGDCANVFDGEGKEYICTVLDAGMPSKLKIDEMITGPVESPIRIILAQSLLKGEKFDLVVQKSTELGVVSIIPILTEHSEFRVHQDSVSKRLERWNRISLEAVKQCGRRRLVDIRAPMTLEQSVRQAGPSLYFNQRGGMPINLALEETKHSKNITLFVGPEGGWSEGEIAILRDNGAIGVTLGARVLRAETAAITAIALVQFLAGDLK